MPRLRTILLLLAAPLLCVGGMATAWLTRPPAFRSHSEVVAYLLSERGVKTSAVYTSLPWPDGVNYYAYGPSVYPFNLNLDIRLLDGQRLLGSVECRNDRRDCLLSVARLGIERQPMPDVTTRPNLALPRWLRRLAQQLQL
jgi:hypothetical protein